MNALQIVVLGGYMSALDLEKYKVKGVCMEDGKTVVCGYYYRNVCHFIDTENDDYEKKLEYPTTAHEVNPYTLCRNTGIKLNDGTYLYEYDLVEYSNGMTGKKLLGVIEFDDWYKAFCIRTSANYSSKLEIRKFTLKVVGNVVLSDDDLLRFQKYSDEMDSKGATDVKVECRSTQHINKLAKQHLPRG